jgi:hypothetical protein
MKLRALTFPIVVVLGVLGSPARAGLLTERWVTTPGGTPDGAALGDLDGDGRLEIAMLVRGGTYSSTQKTPGVGSLVVLNQNGSVRFQVQTGQELVGYPTFGDFDGDSFDEVAFCEVAEVGYCYAYDGDGTQMFRFGPLWHPAMTNGGPIAADINGDGYDDLIAIGSAGEITAVRGPSGTLAWQYDLYEVWGDYPFGHAAVDDIDGDGKYELAVGGTQRGGVYMLNAESGTMQWAVPNLYAQYQNYFHGSGPTLVNLDNDAALEVTASMAGYPGPAAVLALDSNGTVLWRTTVTSDSLYYTSPSAADTDGDGKPEVFVQTTGGWLLKLAANNGSLLQQKSLGGTSWASPGFMDNDYDGRMEIVTSTLSSVYLLDSNLSEIDRYTNTNSGLYPPPVIGDTDANGQLDLVTGAWFPKQVLSIRLPYTSAYSWSTFAGSSLHGGAVSTSPDSLLGDDPAPAIVVILTQVHNLIAQVSGNTAKTQLTNARFDLDLAYREYLRGNPHLAVDRLKLALAHLRAVPSASYDTTPIQQRVAWVGIMMFEQYINRTQALVGPNQSQVVSARTALATAKSRYATPNYTTSIQASDDGALALRNFLDNSSYTVGSFCPQALGETYFAWECRIISVRTAVQALRAQYPSDDDLEDAETNLRGCVVWGPDIVFDQAYPFCRNADSDLAGFTRSNVTQLRKDLAFAIMRNTRLFIDDATIWFRNYDQSALTSAESYYAQGETAYNSGSYGTAHARFLSAYTQARPCADDSFGNNAEGLEGGGCDP